MYIYKNLNSSYFYIGTWKKKNIQQNCTQNFLASHITLQNDYITMKSKPNSIQNRMNQSDLLQQL